MINKTFSNNAIINININNRPLEISCMVVQNMLGFVRASHMRGVRACKHAWTEDESAASSALWQDACQFF